MSKKKQESTPASENFVAVASPRPTTGHASDITFTTGVDVPANSIPQVPHITNVPNLHFDPQADMNVALSGNDLAPPTVSETAQNCYYPTTTWPNAPYIGDPIGDLAKKWVPGDKDITPWVIPKDPWNPRTMPNNGGNFTVTPLYWGVLTDPTREKNKARYYLASPLQIPLFLCSGVTVIARCENEGDARRIADLMNDVEVPAKEDSKSEDIQEEAKRRDRGIRYQYVQPIVKALAGRVLTILESAGLPERQEAALKSITKRSFRETMSSIFDYCHNYSDDLSDEQTGANSDILLED